MINQKIVITLFTCIFFLPITSTELIKGDPDAPTGTSFSFAIKQSLMSGLGNFYVGSNELLAANQIYSLSRFSRNSQSFEPIAPETVVYNGQVDQPNPIYGAKINQLNLLKPAGGADSPVVVTSANPAIVYLIEKSFNITQMNIVGTEPVRDADGLPSSGIISITTDILSHVFAAVKPALSTFGDSGSGIALLVRGNIDDTTVFGEIDAATGMLSPTPKALPLDKSSSILTMNGADLSAMGSVASLYWDTHLNKLFIGLNVTSNNGSTDGALAVVVGTLTENGGLSLSPIAPTTAFAPGNLNNIIGVHNGPQVINQEINIYQLTSLYTSTGLNYLIVLGGVVTDDTTQQSVFALPLVNAGETTGMIAQKNALPHDEFSTGDVPKLTARTIDSVATDQSDMPQAQDEPVRVGGGNLPAGAITQLIVRDDTIFACVGNDTINQDASGVYSSQAIFNAAGKIKGWTQWQRATGTTNNVFGGSLDIFDGTFISTIGNTPDTVNTALKTTWSDGNPQGLKSVTTFLNSIFNPANGGIQSLQTFVPSTPGLAEIAVMVTGGIGTVVLVQTGVLENDITLPTPADHYDTINTYENGTITDMVNAKIVAISGGALNNVGPITATTIATDNVNGWLFAGGSDGLAVLAHPDGSGWNIAQNELGNAFDGLTPGMSFHSIGDYTFVKKLICDNAFLYVVTNDRIDRINLTTSNFSTNTLDAITVATKESLNIVTSTGSILDAIISQACALVATTGGLLRIGDEQDIRTVTNPIEADWTLVSIPENAGAPTQLLGVSVTGRDEDITRSVGGQLYVLTSNEGYNQSRINRFAVEPLVKNQPMQSTIIRPFNDLFVENIPSFFLNFGNFNSIFATDGALYFATRSQNNAQQPRTVLTPTYPAPQVSMRNVGERSSTVSINYNNGIEINGFQRSQASGSWIAAGDFGMQALE